MFTFPFELIPRNSNIIIYGAGNVGKDFTDQVLETNSCKLICILDKFSTKRTYNGVPILEPNLICNVGSYDFIIVAVDSISSAMKIQQDLCDIGVSKDKIIHGSIFSLNDKIVELYSKFSKQGLGTINNRIDIRLVRLEILQYYSLEENYLRLTDEQRLVLKDVQNYNDLTSRTFEEDPFYVTSQDSNIKPPEVFEDEYGFYGLINGHKIYLYNTLKSSRWLLHSFFQFYEDETSPHRYLNPQKDNIDIPDGSILCDVGAAEGYFGMKYINKFRKVYFFECDDFWVRQLKKTVATHKKAEVISQAVGDTADCLKLDEFFINREKPNFVKIDVEGSEGAVLRGMRGIIESDAPLTLLICTYHRQEDWSRYENLLNPDPSNPRFTIVPSEGYYWHMPDAKPPYFRRGVMRAKKLI